MTNQTLPSIREAKKNLATSSDYLLSEKQYKEVEGICDAYKQGMLDSTSLSNVVNPHTDRKKRCAWALGHLDALTTKFTTYIK